MIVTCDRAVGRFVEKVDICSMMYMSVSELLVAGLEDGTLAFWNPDSKR